ncbi:hypothetical protein [Rhodococcus sp. B10]|uniref:hypothetical protein n=1 Tax=Rhodococcus sp. B10 TaxID=2695876 RepID=UPI001431D3A7|nr:hypothetical protein [Rhodococcus sp. B10]NIL77167.1 hypothetical protein [Rhodococcus sp. B10]
MSSNWKSIEVQLTNTAGVKSALSAGNPYGTSTIEDLHSAAIALVDVIDGARAVSAGEIDQEELDQLIERANSL